MSQIQDIIKYSKEKIAAELEELGVPKKPANTGHEKLLAALAGALGLNEEETLAAYVAHNKDKEIKGSIDTEKSIAGGFIVNIQKTEKNKADVFLGHRGRSAQIQRGKNILITPWMMTSLSESSKRIHDRDPATGAVLDKFDIVHRYSHSVLMTLTPAQVESLNGKVEFSNAEVDALRAG